MVVHWESASGRWSGADATLKRCGLLTGSPEWQQRREDGRTSTVVTRRFCASVESQLGAKAWLS
jgi:hypothetical protein